MTYSKITDFASKDYLLTGNPSKIIRGTEINDELTAIENEFSNGVVAKSGNAGSAKIPYGSQAQRDASPAIGYARFNTTTGAFEGWNGSEWGPLGSNNGPVVDIETYTATASQTVFNLVNGYEPGRSQLEVYINGLLMTLTTDYAETDLDTVTFVSGLTEGDEVTFRVWRSDTMVDGDAANMSYSPAGGSAVTTSVQAKLRETVSVKDFGAVGDGVTDDTAAIQAAITSASGKLLHIPSGSYLTSKITLPSNITIIGDGASSVIKLNNSQDDHLFYATGQQGITLDNFVLDGNKSNQTVGAVSRCFYALDTSDIRLINITVQNAADHGLHISVGPTTDPLTDSLRVWLDKCKFINNGTTTSGGNGGSGAAVTCKYLWATDCYSEGNILSGFKFTGANLSAKGCYAIDNDCGGFSTGFDSVTEEGTYHVYDACYALNNGNGADGGDGFRHQGQVDRIIHRDCFAVGNAWSGIALVANTTVKPTDIDISGGSILNNGQNFTASSTVAGSGIAILSTTSSPSVPINTRINNVTITDTQGTKTQEYGIRIEKGDDVYIGDGCRLSGNKNGSLYNGATLTSLVRLSANIIDADFINRTITAGSVTGTISETDLQSITIPANTLGVGQRYRIHARGSASGTAGTKAFRIYFGSANALFSSQIAADQQEWFIDAVVEISGVAAQKVSFTGVEIGGQTTSSILSSTSNVNSAITCKITGTLGATGDTAACASFFFEPIY